MADASPTSRSFYKVAEAAELLRVDAVTIYRAIRKGQFPAVKIQSRHVVPAQAITALTEEALRTHAFVDVTDYTPPAPPGRRRARGRRVGVRRPPPTEHDNRLVLMAADGPSPPEHQRIDHNRPQRAKRSTDTAFRRTGAHRGQRVSQWNIERVDVGVVCVRVRRMILGTIAVLIIIGALILSPFRRRIGGAGGGSEKASVGAWWLLFAVAVGLIFAYR